MVPQVEYTLQTLQYDVHSIAVGTEGMTVGGFHGIFDFAIPDPQANVAERLQGVLALSTKPGATVNWGGLIIPHGPRVGPRWVMTQTMQVCSNLLIKPHSTQQDIVHIPQHNPVLPLNLDSTWI